LPLLVAGTGGVKILVNTIHPSFRIIDTSLVDKVSFYFFWLNRCEDKHGRWKGLFYNGSEDEDYDIAVETVQDETTETFLDAVLHIRKREQELTSKARRTSSNYPPPQGGKGEKRRADIDES
jgi:hypothetical protein